MDVKIDENTTWKFKDNLKIRDLIGIKSKEDPIERIALLCSKILLEPKKTYEQILDMDVSFLTKLNDLFKKYKDFL